MPDLLAPDPFRKDCLCECVCVCGKNRGDSTERRCRGFIRERKRSRVGFMVIEGVGMDGIVMVVASLLPEQTKPRR